MSIMNTIKHDISHAVAVALLVSKIKKDLRKVSRTFGNSPHVKGEITIYYSGFTVSEFDDAILRVEGYHVYNNQFLIRNGLTVWLVLE